MTRAVAAVAAGQTDHVSRRVDVGIPELAREAIDRCLDTRDLTLADVDALVVGNMEMFEGINLVEHWMADAIGAAGKPLWKLNNGGTVGSSTAVAAYHLVSSGFHRRVLCVGFEKQAEGSTQSAITTVGDPIWERAVMAGAIGNFAAMTSVYVNESGATAEQAAKVAVKARRNATRNPHAHLKIADITVESVLASDMLAYPVRKLDMCPSSDGAVAVLFGADEDARSLAPRPAWVHAAVTAHDQQYMGDSPKRLAEMRSLIEARAKGYALAGIDDPVRDFDVAEIYEPATYAELAMYECLGFCPKGGGGAFIDLGTPEMDGALPVNPSGGVLSANPVGATALIRVAEASLQVMNEAGKRQVPHVERALATGYGGNAWTDLLILGREQP
jgi:acetyl-CoA C-acetyltransferase